MERRDFRFEFAGVSLGCARFERVPGRPPLVFVPGTMGHVAESLPFLSALAGHFSVLSFDYPGLGASPASPDTTPERLSRVLGALCATAFDDAPFAIYGVSLGAVVAALMARARPSRVRALMLDDPVFEPGAFAEIGRYARNLARETPPGHPVLAAFAAFTGWDPATGGHDGRGYAHLWPELAVPTTILAGDAFDAAAARAAAACPGLRGIEQLAGHPVWARDPADRAARMAAFATATPPPPAEDPVRADEYALRLSGGVSAICARDTGSTSTVVLLERETWFEDEFAFVGRLVGPGWRAADGGTNIGVYTLTLARAGADMLAFEPNPPIADRARRAIALNGLDARVRLRIAALGERPGVARFETAAQPENAHLAASGGIEVPVTTLDEEIAALGWTALDFVKLDLEGGEADALRGARRTLARTSPLVMSEIVRADGTANPAPLEELRAQGYSLFALVPGLDALVPTDFADADPFRAYGFGAKADRIDAMAAAGRLVRALPDPEPIDDPAPFLAAAAARLAAIVGNPALARRLAAPQGPAAETYAEAIARFERARMAGRALPARAADLAAAAAAAGVAYAARPGLARALTYARIARAAGRRKAAVDALSRTLSSIYAGARLDPDEPLLPPLARYEGLPATNAGDWLMAALAEGFTAISSFAAGFSIQGHLGGFWTFLEERGFATPEVERGRQIQAMVAGAQAEPVAHPRLARFAPDNRNPEIWRGL